jgi:hypothetical protein
MNCKKCNTPGPPHEIIDGLCHRCCANRLRTAKTSLGIIMLTETYMPPALQDGKVVHVRGFSAQGHQICVELARKTYNDIAPESEQADMKEINK